ncbi:MAG: NAD(P)-binding domain-containing protein [Candidatus Kerfeldbacteria bacterium]|nr:NAD(P)-binding domain-containing protein [Candidatus Kerfeldbacteria bacterium]
MDERDKPGQVLGVGIVGYGRLGRALHRLIDHGRSRAAVLIWNRTRINVPGWTSIHQLAQQAEVILLCIPSFALRQLLETLKPALRSSTVLVSFAKGIEHTSGQTVDQVFATVVPTQPFALVGGPMLAEELVAGRQGIAVVGTHDPTIYLKLVYLFDGTELLLEPSGDPRAVSLAGVLKNVYALAVGISYGVGCQPGECQNFRQRALQEMLAVGQHLRLPTSTINGPAGVGDFMTTSSSPLSRNRRAGERLGQDGSLDREAESIASFPHLIALVGELAAFPILRATSQAVMHGQSVGRAFAAVLPGAGQSGDKNPSRS